MEFRRVGRSGLALSEIAYGNWLTHAGQVEAEVAVQCVHAALEVGISTFDTADVYANTLAEEVLGSALRGQRRESIEVCTKVYFPTGPRGHNDKGLGRKHIFESAHASLRRLGTDYIDLYQLHRFDPDTPLEETMSALADLVHMGKVLYLGVSEWSADQIRDAARLASDLHVPLVSNQPQYSMLWRSIEDSVVPECQELGIGQIVFSPLAQGVLTGKYKAETAPPPGSRAADPEGSAFIGKWMTPAVLRAVADLAPIASDLGLTTAQLAIAWVLQNQNVASAVMGASRPEQVHQNAVASGVKLDTDVMLHIDSLLQGISERTDA
jgi:aryl-alcohol dehydrogenase-like predicted oxidoreductase